MLLLYINYFFNQSRPLFAQIGLVIGLVGVVCGGIALILDNR